MVRASAPKGPAGWRGLCPSGPSRAIAFARTRSRRATSLVASASETAAIHSSTGRRQTSRRSRARPAALVLHQLQGHPERRPRHREDEVDLVGLEIPLQEHASAFQFGLGVFEVVDLNPEMADDRTLAIHELWHAETSSADLNQL